ncbi:hypothetical protein [Catellatospora methionotrophica]|uniref:hypothetical protein n=1 Tax=Catellatospora methionotrophica TaxID=121620 RepID=UPI0033FA9E1E
MHRFSPARRTRARTLAAVTGLATLLTALGTIPAAAAAPAAAPAATAERPLTADTAVDKARKSGKPVKVDTLTTETDEVTVNPNGTLTLARSLTTQRKRVDGKWRDLDAKLRRNADGSVSPALSESPISFSGGGTGPLARMVRDGKAVSLTMPMALPKPTLSGDTATYAGVLPGVDLQVTATETGGFSQVLVVRDAAAAANPALKTLTMATSAEGLSLATDGTGAISGRDGAGREHLYAPAPIMWDSRAAATPKVGAKSADQGLAPSGTGAPTSSNRGPGRDARKARVAAKVTSAGIALTPDAGLLTGKDVTYPVFIDPTLVWSSAAATRGGWATVTKNYPSSPYWNKTPEPNGFMQVGNAGTIWSHTLIKFDLPLTTLAGATINKASLNMFEVWSYSCQKRDVNLYAYPTTLQLSSSNATWNYWDGQNEGSRIDYKNVAYGNEGMGCNDAAVGFDVTPEVTANVTANKGSRTFMFAAENEANDLHGYKEFKVSEAKLLIEYNHKPNKPVGLTTSPTTSCAATPPSTVGDASVTMFAPVSDNNGGNLGVEFQLWKTSTPGTILLASNPETLSRGSGQTAQLTVPVETLRLAAGGAITDFSWRVRALDGGTALGDWSDTCSFRFDTTRTGAPTVGVPAGAVMGQPAAFSIAKPPTGTAPSGYIYQLNSGAPVSVTADAAGNAAISVKPTRRTNTIAVTSLSAGGNIGDTASVIFDAAPAAPAANGDLTGDGKADLLTQGGVNGLPAGVWLASGTGTGQIDVIGTNIGVNGNGTSGQRNPADFTGAQLVSGTFTGSGLQDVLAYYPSGSNAGGGSIIAGNGDGSALQSIGGNQYTISSNVLQLTNEDGDPIAGSQPLQIANAGDTIGNGEAYPDLLTISSNAGAYGLAYFIHASVNNFQPALVLSTATPTGGADWNNWRLAATQTATGTALYLWNPTTGALHLWRGLSVGYDDLTGAYRLDHTQTVVKASGWNPGLVSLHAADINSDGTPDLWSVGSGGVVTAHLVTGLTGTPAVTAQAVQPLITSKHAWMLNDASSGAVTAGQAKDIVGGLHASGNSGTQWRTGDLFSPSVKFTSAQSGTLAASGPAIATNADFNLGVWVKLDSFDGVVLSQDGSSVAAFKLWTDGSDRSWRMALSRADTTTNTQWDTAIAAPGTAALGTWAYVSVHFLKSKNMALLKINGVIAASVDHTTTWNATGAFRISGVKTAAASYGSYLNGQVAAVQTWDVANMPTTGNTVHCTAPVAVYGVNPDGSLTYTLIEPYTGTIVRKLTSTAKLGYTAVSIATLNNNTLLVPGTDGILRRIDILSNSGSLTFDTPDQLGSGWTLYQAGFDGTYYYGITGPGALRRYQVIAAKPELTDIINWSTVGTGFGLRTFTTTAPNYVIGSRESDGLVRNYRITSPTTWESESPGNWGTSVNSAFSPGGGLYYVRDNANNVTLYLDAAPTVLDANPIPHITTPVGSAADWGQAMLSAQPNICG